MTIELVTGTPGAGKTTYTVAMRLVQEEKRRVQIDDDTCIKLGLDLGTVVQRRVIVAGIRGLKMEHERLPHVLTRDAVTASEADAWGALDGEAPRHQRLPGEPPKDVPAIVQNWWLWCKPGDLIVVDEAQFVAPRGTMGRKPPYWVQALEIHRHYGVDWIVITQHPNLIDPTIRALVGSHKHVRSVMGSAVCMVYVWDHASNPERYTNANKTTFVRRAKHYALFHSSVAHMKPPTSGRFVMWLLPLLVIAMVVVGSRMTNRLHSIGKPGADALPLAQAQAAQGTGVSPAVPLDARYQPARVAGCFHVGARCECMGENAEPLYLPQKLCADSAAGFGGAIRWAPRPAVEVAAAAASAPPHAPSPELLAGR